MINQKRVNVGNVASAPTVRSVEAVSQSHMKAVPWEIVSRRCLRRLEVDISGLDNFSPENKTGLKLSGCCAGLMVYRENKESAHYLLSGTSAGRWEKLR